MIEIGGKISLEKLKEIAISENFNPGIPFGPYQISKRQILDMYIGLFQKKLDDSDSVILYTDFKKGTFYAGEYKIYGDVYGSIWLEIVKKDNCEC